MISRELEAEILRLHHAEGWPVGTLARQLRVHHGTVRRVLLQAGIAVALQRPRASMIDAYVGFIQDTLGRYPTLRASRLYQMARERGYTGGPDHFRHCVARYRPRPAAEAYLRLRSLAGEQAQVDWAHFGRLAIGRATRPLLGFVMVLSYSRALYLRFYLSASMGSFLDGHVHAFEFFGGVPRHCLYDNLKSAVLERRGDAIRFHPTMLELAAWYRFQPRPVGIARGNEKGRVERAIRFVRERFFAARQFADLADLNAQALAWCAGEAAQRPCPEDRSRSVQACFEAERPRLLALPTEPFPVHERVVVRSHKTPYVRFDLNDYSIPHTHVQRTLLVLASLTQVRVLDGLELIACHTRSFDRGAQIEDPAHLQTLIDHKRTARAHRAMDRLHHAADNAAALFKLAAARGVNLGALTRGLIELLDNHGAALLHTAIAAALREDAAHLGAVRHCLDRELARRGQPPPIALSLPDDPRVRDLSVRAHPLTDYQQLLPEAPHECTDEHPDESGTDEQG